jgi:hypothetical protein
MVDASWVTLMEEAQRIEAFDNLEYISEVFIAINDHLAKQNTVTSLPPKRDYVPMLTQSRIFPTGSRQSDASFDQLSTAQEDDIWFIADRWHLRQSFEGLIPLLALSVDSVNKIHSMVKELGLEHRLLSRIVSGVPKTEGPSKTQSQQTALLRAKARSIARCVFYFSLKETEFFDHVFTYSFDS